MRVPEPLTRTDEIVAEIARKLDANPTIVRNALEASHVLQNFGPLAGYRKANEKSARSVLKWVDDGQKLFAELPKKKGTLLDMLFGGHSQRVDLQASAKPAKRLDRLEVVGTRTEAGYEILTGLLDMLRLRCEWIIEERIGRHGSAGHLQEVAAITARALCEKYDKPLASSSPTTVYRSITRLIYEAMTGEYDRDTRRACELIARQSTHTERR
jgi:hypothetical protein